METRDEYIIWLAKSSKGRPFVAPVGTAVVLNEKYEILLEQRSDNGKWSLPAGYMEPGETIEETAIRELREETGLIAKAEDLILITTLSGVEHVTYYPQTNSTVYPLKVIFLVPNYRGELEMNEESTRLEFFRPENFPEKASSTTRKIAEILLKKGYIPRF